MGDYFRTRYAYDNGRAGVWRAICEYLQPEVPVRATLLELGAGYCDFINQIEAPIRYALDVDPTAAEYCAEGVQFLRASALDIPLPPGSVDLIFASNLLEHFDDTELKMLVARIRGLLRPGGRLILIQPNYFYAYREYWDDYTHKKAFTHVSLNDFLVANGFRIRCAEPRFLPFSFKSRVPRSYWLARLYLHAPWRPRAKQMLVIADIEDETHVRR
jgi:SAM-dependent methyltransferase